MWIPEGLEQRRFGEWNRLVRELIEVWDVAHSLGRETWMQEQITSCREEAEFLERLAALRLQLAEEGKRSGYNLAETADGLSTPDGQRASSRSGDAAGEPGGLPCENGAEE